MFCRPSPRASTLLVILVEKHRRRSIPRLSPPSLPPEATEDLHCTLFIHSRYVSSLYQSAQVIDLLRLGYRQTKREKLMHVPPRCPAVRSRTQIHSPSHSHPSVHDNLTPSPHKAPLPLSLTRPAGQANVLLRNSSISSVHHILQLSALRLLMQMTIDPVPQLIVFQRIEKPQTQKTSGKLVKPHKNLPKKSYTSRTK